MMHAFLMTPDGTCLGTLCLIPSCTAETSVEWHKLRRVMPSDPLVGLHALYCKHTHMHIL